MFAADQSKTQTATMAVTAEEKTKKKATGHDCIDLSQPYELGYWARKFGVSEQSVAEAVHRVGTNAEDVAIELKPAATGRKRVNKISRW